MESYKPDKPASPDDKAPDERSESLLHEIMMLEHRATIAEQAVQALSTALEASRAGCWEWNIATGELRIDRQWASVIGYAPEELAPLTIQRWKALCHPDDLGKPGNSLDMHLDGGDAFFEIELRVRHKDGVWMRVLDRGKIHKRDANGKPTGMIGSRQAMPERDTSSDSLHHDETLENSARDLQALIDNIPGAVYRIDASGKTVLLSKPPEFLGMLATGNHETTLFETLSMVHPDDRQKIADSYRKLKEKRQTLTLTYRILTPHNRQKWIEDHKTSTFSEDGLFTGIDGILYDITARITTQEETRRLESQLRKSQRLETIGTLAGGIAHDFNNILTPILGYSEMGLATLSEDDPLHEYFSEIMLAAERAQKLVSQILTFSRAQDGKPSSVNIQSIITEALKLLRPSLPSTISIEQHIDDSCRNVMADPSQIHQVIVNLCTNAFHAMEHTGGTLTIGLREMHPGSDRLAEILKLPESSYIELTVSDTGSGMDETTMERIFEPFFTTKSVEKGTGLGLSVVHGIVTGVNGQITVESLKGKGSTFHVYLPVIEEKAPPAPVAKLPVMKNTGSVLFIDDEPAAVQMMTIMMTKLGFKIRAVQSPADALKLFRENPEQYDLVITDLTMPEMTGIQLASALHKISPSIPVILMTGYGKIIDHDIPLSHYGISRLLKKPVKLAQLASAVNEILSVTNPSTST
jgi:two-component system cell cycle sensor histidine kinase/response regulator CckA